MQPLNPHSKRVIEILREHGVVSGRRLEKHTGLNWNELTEALRGLQESQLIEVSGSLYSTEELKRAYFSIRPSASKAADLLSL